jgi:hypothetical protein
MGDVIPFSSQGYAETTLTCTHCRHEWEGIFPPGITQFECPSCHTMKGVIKYPFAAGEGDYLFMCDCGSEYFYVVWKEYPMLRCRECGSDCTDALFDDE